MSIDIQHRNVKKTAFPRTGRALDAVGSNTGGTASGGGGIVNVDVDVDVKEGRGIDVKKDLIGETVIFTVSHEDTSSAVSTSNFDDLFVQNIGVDDFGHVTSVESARLATYLDERYLRKDIDDTAYGNILFDKKIGFS